MEKELFPECTKCNVKEKICTSKTGEGPKFCPTITKDKTINNAMKEYQNSETMLFAKLASLQEAECYERRNEKPFVRRPTKTRVEEIVEFSKKMNYRRLGVAFCAGLFSEASTFVSILESHGFEVVSVCCKVGGVDKEFLGLRDDEKVKVGSYEAMCNPITQAEILNEAVTDFNIMIGLCVGHDSLFLKHVKALTTILIAKDRVLGHNPVAALYGTKGYFKRLKNP